MCRPSSSSKTGDKVVNHAVWYGRFLQAASVHVPTVNVIKMFDDAGAISTLVENTTRMLMNVQIIVYAAYVSESGQEVR